LYEYNINKLGTSGEYIHLPQKDWRYYVISFDGFNDKIMDLRYSANLLKNDINIGFEFISIIGGGRGTQYNQFISSTFFADQHIGFSPPLSLESNELLEINANYNNITKLDKTKYTNISRAISDFYQTKMITDLSVLKVLSYFSILECLLTHIPRPIDTIGSLTHQVSTKMSLLSKRFQRKLEYTTYFPQLPKPENVWGKLYSYRSAIAHGGEANYDGEFKALISQDNIRIHLKESIKLLLLYSLKEPEFITDFQKC